MLARKVATLLRLVVFAAGSPNSTGTGASSIG